MFLNLIQKDEETRYTHSSEYQLQHPQTQVRKIHIFLT